jgi:hypothetical protein
MSRDLILTKVKSKLVVASGNDLWVPRLIAEAGDHAARPFLEFFAATIRNKNTRLAYLHAVGQILRLV